MSDHRPQWVRDREREQEIMGEPPASGYVPGDTARVLLYLVGFVAVCALGVVVYCIKAGLMYTVGKAVVG